LNSDGGKAPVRDLGDDVSRHYELTLGRDERTGDHRYLYEALVLALRDRMVGSWRHTQGHYLQSNEKQVPVDGIPHRAQPAQRDPVHGRRGRCARCGCALCLRNRGRGGGGAGRGPRQRRPRAPRRLFPRQLCGPVPPGHGLRHPLRVRHVPAAPARRLPGRGAGPLAAPRQPLGVRVRECTRQVRFHGRTETYTDDAGAPAPSLGGYARRSRRALRHARARLPQRHGEYAAPVAREATEAFDLVEFNAGSYSDAVAAKNHGGADHHGAVPE
jgi:starch phosphorylase